MAYVLFLPLALFSTQTYSKPACDKQFVRVDGHSGYQYRKQLGYCEGMYRTDVSADIKLVGFLAGDYTVHAAPEAERYSVRPLLATAHYKKKQTRIVGNALNPALFYRLDKFLEKDMGSFLWHRPTYLNTFKSERLGFFGKIGKSQDSLFFPVQLSENTSTLANLPRGYTVLIKPPLALEGYGWKLIDPEMHVIQRGGESRRIARNDVFAIFSDFPSGRHTLSVELNFTGGDGYIGREFNIYIP